VDGHVVEIVLTLARYVHVTAGVTCHPGAALCFMMLAHDSVIDTRGDYSAHHGTALNDWFHRPERFVVDEL
jgi:hypothetical protein